MALFELHPGPSQEEVCLRKVLKVAVSDNTTRLHVMSSKYQIQKYLVNAIWCSQFNMQGIFKASLISHSVVQGV